MNTPLIIGSRGSDLALWQANFIANELRTKVGREVSIKIIKTSGDRLDTLPFNQMEGKGFFTKELEEALLKEEIDLAVHSLKDLMTSQPEGLKLGAVGYRADRRELLLIRRESHVAGTVLPVREGSTVGTGSPRRCCQVAALAPSLRLEGLRGNVPTRVEKLRQGHYDAIVLAKAGIDRLKLDLSDLVQVALDPKVFLPAPAQGILGVQIRSDDEGTASAVSPLEAADDRVEAGLERGLLARFEAGCSLPLGVFSDVSGDALCLQAVLGIQDGEDFTGLRRVELQGTKIDELVDRAFTQLTAPEGL